MKNTLIISAAAFLFLTASQMCGCGCKVSAQTTEKQQTVSNKTKTVTLKITGMTCSGCANTIHTALSKKDGIIENEVKYPGDVAVIKYDPNKITEKEIIATIENAGYKTEVKKDDSNSETKTGKKCKDNCKKSCCSKK